MKGRKPFEYRLRDAERRYLNEIVRDGQQLQRVATRARTLLALDRGERIVEIMRWLGVSRMGVWHLWQRYQHRGVAAIFDGERNGRPVVFSPARAGPDRAHRLYRPDGLRAAADPLGLSQSAAGRRRAGGGGRNPLHDGGAYTGGGESATTPQPLLEDGHD